MKKSSLNLEAARISCQLSKRETVYVIAPYSVDVDVFKVMYKAPDQDPIQLYSDVMTDKVHSFLKGMRVAQTIHQP